MEIEDLLFDVAALAGKAEIPLSVYPELQVGDIVLLDQKVEEGFSIRVGDEIRYRGHPGLCETRKAIRIDERV